MLEFRYRDENSWAANVGGLDFTVKKTVRRKKDVFALDIYRHKTSVHSTAHKTFEAAVAKADAWYDKDKE